MVTRKYARDSVKYLIYLLFFCTDYDRWQKLNNIWRLKTFKFAWQSLRPDNYLGWIWIQLFAYRLETRRNIPASKRVQIARIIMRYFLSMSVFVYRIVFVLRSIILFLSPDFSFFCFVWKFKIKSICFRQNFSSKFFKRHAKKYITCLWRVFSIILCSLYCSRYCHNHFMVSVFHVFIKKCGFDCVIWYTKLP